MKIMEARPKSLSLEQYGYSRRSALQSQQEQRLIQRQRKTGFHSGLSKSAWACGAKKSNMKGLASINSTELKSGLVERSNCCGISARAPMAEKHLRATFWFTHSVISIFSWAAGPSLEKTFCNGTRPLYGKARGTARNGFLRTVSSPYSTHLLKA